MLEYKLKRRIDRRFKMMEALSDGWYGEDSYAPSSETLLAAQKAIEVFCSLRPELNPQIFPDSNGSVLLECEERDWGFNAEMVSKDQTIKLILALFDDIEGEQKEFYEESEDFSFIGEYISNSIKPFIKPT